MLHILTGSTRELKNRVTVMTSKKTNKSNCDVLANYSLILRNLELLMKIKFPNYITWEFDLYLITLKFSSYAIREFKIH